MSGHNIIFDYEKGDYIIKISDDMGIDSDGNMIHRFSDMMAMDMDSGELHLTSSWDSNDDDE